MEENRKAPEQELVESIVLMIDKGLQSTTNIYTGVVKSVDGKRAVVTVNGQNQNVAIATADVSSGNVVRVFVPNGNMSAAFIIKAESSGGGGGGTTTAYGDLTGKPQVNGVTLVDNKTSKELKLYGTGNEPPYPVTSVNGQTGDVTIETGSNVDSVNGKTGTVVLDKSDIGLGNVDNVKQYSASNPPPYPVTSVDGATGAVTTNAVKTTAQSLTTAQKAQARANIGAGTSNFSGSYNDLSDKPTIPDPYTLPIASSTTLGGVKPIDKTDAMTLDVGVDSAGKLYTQKECFEVKATYNSSTRKWSADKTTTEIVKAANDPGKFVYMKRGGVDTPILFLWAIDGDFNCIFGCLEDQGAPQSTLEYVIYFVWDDGTITIYRHNVLTDDDISSDLASDKSSTTKIPSCKAVYDSIPHPDTKTDAQTQSVGMDSDGKLWTVPSGGGTGAVSSVNGKTGEVELIASDVGAVPAPTTITANKWLKTDANKNFVLSDLPSASTAARGITYLVNSYTRTDTDKAVTPKALNDVYKLVPSIPTVTTSDNGKFLRVVNGAWAAATVGDANGVSF